MKAIIRKEVHLPPAAVKRLEKAAKANNAKLKSWMEDILIAESKKPLKKKDDPEMNGGGYNEWHLSDMQ